MKLTFLIATLISTSAIAIIAPVGLHRTLSCTSQGANKFKVYVEQNTHQPKFVKIVIANSDNTEKVYPGTESQSGRVGASVTYTAVAPGGRLDLVINLTSSPVRPGFRSATLISQALGRVTKTQLLCSRIMY